MVGGRVVEAARARRILRHHPRHGAVAHVLQRYQPVRDAESDAWQVAGSRPRDRRHLPDDQECRPRRHSVAEVQPDLPRRRAYGIDENPYHGLNFCQGSVSEMLDKPGEQIFDVIRWFGVRKKIFNVHFRNIRGRFLNFQETFIDDGDVDMLKAMRVYKEIGYDGMMMPDHVPRVDGDANEAQGFAFAFGYIKALIAAVAAES